MLIHLDDAFIVSKFVNAGWITRQAVRSDHTILGTFNHIALVSGTDFYFYSGATEEIYNRESAELFQTLGEETGLRLFIKGSSHGYPNKLHFSRSEPCGTGRTYILFPLTFK